MPASHVIEHTEDVLDGTVSVLDIELVLCHSREVLVRRDDGSDDVGSCCNPGLQSCDSLDVEACRDETVRAEDPHDRDGLQLLRGAA